MDRNEEGSRRFVLRAYGIVSLLQNVLGLCLIGTGIVALRFFDEPIFFNNPPYYLGAFIVGILNIIAGISTMYIYFTKAPVADYYFLEDSAVMRIRHAVTANTCISIFCLICCAGGIFVCIFFAVGPCTSDTYPRRSWTGLCNYRDNITENNFLALFVTMFLAATFLVLIYSSLMKCIHGWVFDFDVVNIRVNGRKHEERPVSLYQQADIFDMEEPAAREAEEDALVVNKYNETSSFKQSHHKSRNSHDPSLAYQCDETRTHHIPPPSYTAVLNDPAMKQKLQERNSKLQDT